MTGDEYGNAYQRGFDKTVRFLVSRGVTRDEARDVAQVAWMRGWERLAQLRSQGLLITWINAIALNVYRSLTRSRHITYTELEPEHATTEINLAAIDLARILAECRPSDRNLLESFMTGATMAEIARAKGVSKTTIRVRMLRARRKARYLLAERQVLRAASPFDRIQ